MGKSKKLKPETKRKQSSLNSRKCYLQKLIHNRRKNFPKEMTIFNNKNSEGIYQKLYRSI